MLETVPRLLSKLTRSALAVVLGTGLIAAAATAAAAGVIYENPGFGGGAITSDLDASGIEHAASFQLAPGRTTITGIHWLGATPADSPWTPSVPPPAPPAPDDFVVRIFADDGGLPAATPITEIAVGGNATRTATPHSLEAGWGVFEYSVGVSPVLLAANVVYWISIANDTAGDSWTWMWVTSSVSGQRVLRGNGTGGAWRLELLAPATDGLVAFRLTDDDLAVPEPATVLLLAPFLGAVALRRGRR